MAWFTFKANKVLDQADLNATYLDNLPLVSPYADNSHLERLTFENLYGIQDSTLVVTRDVAMSIAAVAKARNLMATSIGSMPLYAQKNGHTLETQPALLTQLSKNTTNFNVISWTVDGLMFYGRAFWRIDEFTQDGRPRYITFVPEWKAEVNEEGRLVKAFDKSINEGQYIRIDANNEGFLNYGREVIRTAKQFEIAAAEAGENPIPALALVQKPGTTDLSQEEISGLLAGWRAARKKRGGSISYLNSSVGIESLGQNAENLLIDGLNYNVLQIARALGLPAHALDATVQGSSLSYSNQGSRNRELIQSFSGLMVAIESTLSMYFPAGQTIRFDSAELLRADNKERFETYATAISAGFLTKDEVRAQENLEPLPKELPQNDPKPVEVVPAEDTTPKESA